MLAYYIIINFAATDVPVGRSINDTVMGGVSSSRLRIDQGVGVFSGTVSLENNGGFASRRFELPSQDLSDYSGVVIRQRGDGQRYRLRLHDGDRTDSIAHQSTFTATADWQQVRIPFSAFQPTFRGRTPANAPPLNTAAIQQLGLMIADKQPGSFRLEVAWIGAY